MINADNSVVCLGIDPGLGRMGYGLVLQKGDSLIAKSYGVVETPANTPLPIRLNKLYNDLHKIVKETRVDVIAVEQLYFGKNVTTAGMVWQARGVILLFASQMGILPIEPKPAEVKLSVCGYGNADKLQVQGMVQHILNLREIPKPDDAADALAVAIAGLALASYKANIMER